MGVAMAANLFTLFIFYEVLTFSTYPLVTHKGDAAAQRAGRIYLGTLVGASVLLFLPGIIAVAVLGMMMLSGRIPVREGMRVLLGCFLLLGAPARSTILARPGRGAATSSGTPDWS